MTRVIKAPGIRARRDIAIRKTTPSNESIKLTRTAVELCLIAPYRRDIPDATFGIKIKMAIQLKPFAKDPNDPSPINISKTAIAIAPSRRSRQQQKCRKTI